MGSLLSSLFVSRSELDAKFMYLYTLSQHNHERNQELNALLKINKQMVVALSNQVQEMEQIIFRQGEEIAQLRATASVVTPRGEVAEGVAAWGTG